MGTERTNLPRVAGSCVIGTETGVIAPSFGSSNCPTRSAKEGDGAEPPITIGPSEVSSSLLSESLNSSSSISSSSTASLFFPSLAAGPRSRRGFADNSGVADVIADGRATVRDGALI